MAVGARQSDILQQFLIEAILVCILGGILGVLLSLGLGQLVTKLSNGSFQMAYSTTSMIAAFVCSSMIGIVFGFYRHVMLHSLILLPPFQENKENFMSLQLTKLAAALFLTSSLVGCAAMVKHHHMSSQIYKFRAAFRTAR